MLWIRQSFWDSNKFFVVFTSNICFSIQTYCFFGVKSAYIQNTRNGKNLSSFVLNKNIKFWVLRVGSYFFVELSEISCMINRFWLTSQIIHYLKQKPATHCGKNLLTKYESVRIFNNFNQWLNSCFTISYFLYQV